MKIEDYIDYIEQPINLILHNKTTMIVISGAMSVFYALTHFIGDSMMYLATMLAINISFIWLYFILSFADLFAGIYVNVFVGKQKFESKKFLKKILLIGMGILMLGMTVILSNTFLFYEDRENAVLRGLLDGIVFLFEGVKITMIIFFVIYELTSLKEKAEKMKWNSLINLLNVFLIPFIKIQNFVNRKIDKTLEDEENKQ
jgi:hypothetical protein